MNRLPIIQQIIKKLLLPLVGIFFFSYNGMSQSCTDRNASLDDGALCTRQFSLSEFGDTDPDHRLQLRDESGEIIAGNTVTSVHLNQVLEYSILDDSDNILCWANLIIEDYLAPIITCPADIDISCIESTDPDVNPNLGMAIATDCSGTPTISYTDAVDVSPCNATGDNGAFAAIITRTWLAIDPNNLRSTCTQIIRVERVDINDISFPSDLTQACASGTSIDTDPTNTGYPTYDPDGAGGVDEINIIPGQANGYCMLSSFYTDVTIDKCGASSQVRRTWNVLNMCSDGVPNVLTGEMVQVIEITQPAPVFNTVADVTVAADNGNAAVSNCSSTASLPMASLAALCSGQTVGDITIVTPVGTTTNGGAIPSPGLRIGTHTVTYMVTDNCGNVSSLDVNVTVTDQTPPSAQCDDIRLTLSGATDQISAESFNQGSRDNCSSTVYVKVARLDHTNNDATVGSYGDEVDVSCSDVDVNIDGGDGDVRVGLLVFDQDPDDPDNWSTGVVPTITSNNTNAAPLSNFLGNIGFCWSEADIENKLAPEVSCSDYSFTTSASACSPEKVTVDANTGAISDDAANTDGISFAAICGQQLVSISTAEVFSDWTCSNNSTRTLTRTHTFYYDTDGVFDRSLTATDPTAGGHEETLTCTQVITIMDATPLAISNPAASVTLTDCSSLDIGNVTAADVLALLTDAQKVSIAGNDCEALLQTNSVANVVFNSSASELTLDLTYNINATGTNAYCGSSLAHSFVQSITVQGCQLVTPEIESVSLPSCSPDGSLSGNITAALVTGQDVSDFTFEWSVTGGAAIANQTGSTIDATLITKGIEYTVTVSNPNQAGLSDSETFTIPLDYCCVDPSGGITASDEGLITLSVNDNYGDYEVLWIKDGDRDGNNPDNHMGGEVIAEFSEIVVVDNEIEINVNSSGDGNGIYYVYLSNGDCFFVRQITVNITSMLNGQVSTPTGNPLQGVRVALESNQAARIIGEGEVMSEVMTDASGTFEFGNVDLPSLKRLTLFKDGDDRDNISTQDLLILARHILGVKEISSPYAYIAADLTGNGKISTADMLLMRRIILGVTSDMPNNSSWRFVQEDHVFNDMNTILDYEFPESFIFTGEETQEHLSDLNFIAIKIGDLAGAYSVDLQGGNSTSKTLSLETDNQKLLPGAIIEVPIRAGETRNLAGYQHAYQFDTDKLIFTGIDFGQELELGDNNFGYRHLADGYLTTSWFDTEDKNIESGTVIYTLRFEVKEASQLSEVLAISSEYTRAEAYFDEDKLGAVQFNFSEPVGDQLIVTTAPNPFKESAQITFQAPSRGEVVIRVSDISGREVYRTEIDAIKGENQLVINKSDLKKVGIYILKIDFMGSSATQKIVMIK